MAKIFKEKQSTKTVEPEPETQPESAKNESLDADTLAILDEIDELIGEVGEEFALQYVQQGGE